MTLNCPSNQIKANYEVRLKKPTFILVAAAVAKKSTEYLQKLIAGFRRTHT